MTARRIPWWWPALAVAVACTLAAAPAWAQKPAKRSKPAASSKGAAKAGGKPSAAKPSAAKPSTGKPSKDSGKGESASSGKSGKADKAGAASAHQVVERESRIEFDERMVRGQSASGAIYLFQRAPSEFKSIVNVPDSFRPRTVSLLAPRTGKP